MISTIIDIVLTILWSALIIYNTHLQRKTYRLYREVLDEIDKYCDFVNRFSDSQTKFNNAATKNAERHEEALKIIVNYIKAGESNARK